MRPPTFGGSPAPMTPFTPESRSRVVPSPTSLTTATSTGAMKGHTEIQKELIEETHFLDSGTSKTASRTIASTVNKGVSKITPTPKLKQPGRTSFCFGCLLLLVHHLANKLTKLPTIYRDILKETERKGASEASKLQHRWPDSCCDHRDSGEADVKVR